MSYCRWSSDNWKCALYCYADSGGGYTTHVASKKHIGPIPEMPDILKVSVDDWLKAYKAQAKALDESELKPIGLSEDGKTFNDPDPESFLERVKWLKGLGYSIPDYVIDEIQEEIADLEKLLDVSG